MSSLLGYILWHRPFDEADPMGYEAKVESFHSALKSWRPEGLITTECTRFVSLPWFGSLRGAYQDWYVVAHFGALGELNEAAVDGPRRTPHDDVAVLASEGVGGVYALETGDPPATMHTVFHWLSKPAGLVTAEYIQTIKEIAEAVGGSLWRRQMNLGTAPEYCLRAAKGIRDIPGLVHALNADRVIWVG